MSLFSDYSDKFCMENCWTHFSRLIKFTHKALPNFIINFKLRADQHLVTGRRILNWNRISK